MHTLFQLRAGQLQGALRLDLCEELTEFPPEIFQLVDSLEVLNLTGNALQALPPDLYRFRRLRVLFCSNNRFTELPQSLGLCERLETVGFRANKIEHVAGAALPASLRALVLTENQLTELPQALGQLLHLQKLMLSGNRLHRLPQALFQSPRLELLRVASNRLSELPIELARLPRLAWLACAGNLFNSDENENCRPDPISWHELIFGKMLGQGASGVVHQAKWRGKSVAVKLFKGDMTSDGSPQSEMAACLAAGEHPYLVQTLGPLTGHPQGKMGLVMCLLDADFSALANPPSLNSCTRDVYPLPPALAHTTPRQVLKGVASAMAHLHERRILHGDLYAHNILCNLQGGVLLSDLGAAACLSQLNGNTWHLFERMEMNAFACLVQELAQGDAELLNLAKVCSQTDVSLRPSFGEVQNQLAERAGFEPAGGN
jgi:hypothetical protein